MPRKPTETKKFEAILDQVIFLPSEAQKKLKDKYWTRRGKLMPTDARPAPAEIRMLTKSDDITIWWDIKGFKEWFCNDKEFQENMEYTARKGQEKLLEMLNNSEAGDSAMLGAIKLSLEGAGKLVKSSGKDDVIDPTKDMKEDELKEMILGLLPTLFPNYKLTKTSEDEDLQ